MMTATALKTFRAYYLAHATIECTGHMERKFMGRVKAETIREAMDIAKLEYGLDPGDRYHDGLLVEESDELYVEEVF